MSIFQEYIKIKEMPLHEKRKYMAAWSTVKNSSFPLPDAVLNALNMVSVGRKTSFLKWIFTEGMQRALMVRRRIAQELKSKGVNIEELQSAIWSKQARKAYPQLAQFDDDIKQAWHDLGGEPEMLADINAKLEEKGLKPLHYGGENGLIEYVENGTWSEKPIQRGSPFDKQGHDLQLSDDPKITGKVFDHEAGEPFYKFGLNPESGGFIVPMQTKYWSEFLKESQAKTQKIVHSIIQDLQSGKSLEDIIRGGDPKQYAWIKEKLMDDQGNLAQGSFEDKEEMILKALGIEGQNIQKIDKDATNKEGSNRLPLDNYSNKRLAMMKSALKITLNHMIDAGPKKTAGTGTQAGLADDEYYGPATVTAQGSNPKTGKYRMTLNNVGPGMDPAQRAQIVEDLASFIIDDGGGENPPSFAQTIYVQRPRSGFSRIRIPVINLFSGKQWTDPAVKKAMQDGTALSTKYMGHDYSFSPEDVVQIGQNGRAFAKKIIHRHYKTQRSIMPTGINSTAREISPEELERYKNDYHIEKISDNTYRLTKGQDKVVIRRSHDARANKDRWYLVPDEVKQSSDLPILPNTLKIRANTMPGMKEKMTFAPKVAKELLDDYISQIENWKKRSMTGDEEGTAPFGEKQGMVNIGGSRVPGSVAAGIGSLGKIHDDKDDSWRGTAANQAFDFLSKNMGRQEFYYGDINKDPSFLKKLVKAGVPEEKVGEFVDLLHDQINKQRKEIRPGKVEIHGDLNASNVLEVSPDLYEILMDNGYYWRMKKARSVATSIRNKEKGGPDRARGQGTTASSSEDEYDHDYEDSRYNKSNSWGQDDNEEEDDWKDYDIDSEDDDEEIKTKWDRDEVDPAYGNLSQVSDVEDGDRNEPDSTFIAQKKRSVQNPLGDLPSEELPPLRWGRPRSTPLVGKARPQANVPDPNAIVNNWGQSPRKELDPNDVMANWHKRESRLIDYKTWLETDAVYDPKVKVKAGCGFNWWGAAGHPTGISIDGDVKKGRTNGRKK